MTVSYGGRVPNGSTFGCFWKVLGIWRGSVYKLVWRELLAYLILYYSINLLYRFGLNPEQQRIFERLRMYFGNQGDTLPVSFMLGFYVSLVVKRWWDQYKLLPWPDTLALFLNAGIPGATERQRLMRRNIVRYAVLAYVVTLMRVSLRVKKRFPTWQHLVDSGIMMESEKKIFELMDSKTPMSKYWMPLVWATNLINRARKEQLTTSDHIVQTMLTELSDIRRRLGALIGYDTVSVPLVYTQVVSLALYVYFISMLIGSQFVPYAPDELKNKLEGPDVYFPFFTAIQFCFYIGWIKVAEVLINPFGEDDDDIELNWLIDRHIKAAYIIVDEMHEEHPELLKDQYWDDVVPKEIPYTVASEHYRKEEPKGSADHYKVKPQDSLYANVMPHHFKKSLVPDDMYADYESVDTPIVERRKSQNWFSRQLSRTGMGSIRSASTAYSSGGLFVRPRGNSVYGNPENGQVNVPMHKMSIYDRLVGRRSGRAKQFKPSTKFAGAAPMHIKNRPRIPTPDVTKESVDRQNRLAATVANTVSQQMSQSLTLMSQQVPAYPGYTSADVPVVQPTHIITFQRKLYKLNPMAFEPLKKIEVPVSPAHPLTLTELQQDFVDHTTPTLNVEDEIEMNSGSDFSHASKDSMATASVSSKKSLENVDNVEKKSPKIPSRESSFAEVKSNFDRTTPTNNKIFQIEEHAVTDIPSAPPLAYSGSEDRSLGSSASVPTSLSSMGQVLDTPRLRKVSTMSQSTPTGTQKRGEVYV